MGTALVHGNQASVSPIKVPTKCIFSAEILDLKPLQMDKS